MTDDKQTMSIYENNNQFLNKKYPQLLELINTVPRRQVQDRAGEKRLFDPCLYP
jgi:hypothetical protein